LRNIYYKIVFAFTISLIYAVLRYNVFGNVPWEEFPLYITNKAFSLTIVLIFLFTIKDNLNSKDRKTFFNTAFFLSILHVFISFRLLGPEHYSKFYSENELNLVGYFTLFFGISALIGILVLRSDNLLPTENGKLTIPKKLKNVIVIMIPIFILGHLFSMGISGWLEPQNWHGFMIPISLVGFFVVLIYLKSIIKK